MRNRTSLLLAVALAVTFTGCAKRETPVQTALNELRRLGSETEAGLKHSDYSNRLAGAQHRIAAALQKSKDAGAKARIQKALNIYLDAQRSWDRDAERKSSAPAQVLASWNEARRVTEDAYGFAAADPAKRTEIWQQELAVVEAARRAEQEAKEEVVRTETALQARDADAQAQRWAAEQKRADDEAERERARRFAPDGTVYVLTRLSFTTPEGVVSISPGTELKVISKTERGILHVNKGAMETRVPVSAVTNDRDLAAALRSAPVKHAINGARTRSASSAGVDPRMAR